MLVSCAQLWDATYVHRKMGGQLIAEEEKGDKQVQLTSSISSYIHGKMEGQLIAEEERGTNRSS